MRQHPQPPLERARCGRGRGMLHDGLERGGDARRPRPQAPLAAPAQGGGQVDREAEPRDGHQRPGLLGEVRQLLGRRDAPRADGGRPLPPLRGGGGEALRREHDRCRRDSRLDVRRLLRADRGDLRGPRRSAGAHRSRHSGARRRRIGRLRGAVRGSRAWHGTSGCRASRRSTRRVTSTGSSTRASAGSSGATPRHCPRTSSSGSTTSATTCPRSHSTSRGPARRWWRSTTTSSGSASTAIARCSSTPAPSRRGSPTGSRRSARSS